MALPQRPGMNRQQAFQNSFQSFMKDRPANSVFAGFGDFKMRQGNGRKPVTPTPPAAATPLPSVTTPSPLDQPPSMLGQPNPGQGGNPWLNVPQMQPWMNQPSMFPNMMGGNQWGMSPQYQQMLQQIQQYQQQGGTGPAGATPLSGQPQLGGPLPPYNPSGSATISNAFQSGQAPLPTSMPSGWNQNYMPGNYTGGYWGGSSGF